uniref:Secreted protein n=1 Tax=Meloidogyne hapla TaxID=6305 RepID=A0A1I8B3N1_MELHA
MLMGPIINGMPVLNPLVTIITVAPYRRTLIKVGPSLPPAINSVRPQSQLLYRSTRPRSLRSEHQRTNFK